VNRLVPSFLLAGALAAIAAPLVFATDAPAAAVAKTDHSTAAPLAVSTVTGLAISPLLGMGAYGAYQWFTAKEGAARAELPWYAQMEFWLPALLVVGACAAKDALGAVVSPGVKKPLDLIELVENKVSGLVAAGAVAPLVMAAGADLDFSWPLTGLAIPFGLAVFALVWMASHAINVLILLSPWGAIDAALKGARTALLALLTLTAAINPWAGAALSVVVIVVAYCVAGWAFRLTVFGSVFCWDFFTRRSRRCSPRENDNRVFAGGNLPGVPVRTYGRLVQRTAGGLEFFYRPRLWRPGRSAKVPVEKAALAVGKGLFFSSVTADGAGTLFLLPPRYRGHEEVLARAYLMGGGVRNAGLRQAWSGLRELFGGAGAKTQLG